MNNLAVNLCIKYADKYSHTEKIMNLKNKLIELKNEN